MAGNQRDMAAMEEHIRAAMVHAMGLFPEAVLPDVRKLLEKKLAQNDFRGQNAVLAEDYVKRMNTAIFSKAFARIHSGVPESVTAPPNYSRREIEGIVKQRKVLYSKMIKIAKERNLLIVGLNKRVKSFADFQHFVDEARKNEKYKKTIFLLNVDWWQPKGWFVDLHNFYTSCGQFHMVRIHWYALFRDGYSNGIITDPMKASISSFENMIDTADVDIPCNICMRDNVIDVVICSQCKKSICKTCYQKNGCRVSLKCPFCRHPYMA